MISSASTMVDFGQRLQAALNRALGLGVEGRGRLV